MDAKKAQHHLRYVDEGVAFHLINGRTARNLEELANGIASLDEQQYEHHVYFDHNDFSNWIIDVIGDQELGLRLFALDKKMSEIELKKRIVQLERITSSSS